MYTINIKITSFYYNALKTYLNNLKLSSSSTVIFLKKQNNILTLLKSPHGHKKSRNQYKFSYHKCILQYNFLDFSSCCFLLKILQQNIKSDIKIFVKITK